MYECSRCGALIEKNVDACPKCGGPHKDFIVLEGEGIFNKGVDQNLQSKNLHSHFLEKIEYLIKDKEIEMGYIAKKLKLTTYHIEKYILNKSKINYSTYKKFLLEFDPYF